MNPEYPLEGLILKLKLQYFDNLSFSLEKTQRLGKVEGKRRGRKRGRDAWMASLTQRHEFEQILGNGEGQ